jgi:2-haloacid dehalogenase
MACRELGIEPAGMWMVAAHDWDVFGAMRVGCAGAFVARPGQGYAPGFDPPDVMGDDLAEVADRLLTVEFG